VLGPLEAFQTSVRQFTQSIRVRLTAYYGAVLALVLIVFSLGVYIFLVETTNVDVNNMTQTYRRFLIDAAAQSPQDLRHISTNSGLLGPLSFKFQPRDNAAAAEGKQYTYGALRGQFANEQLEAVLFQPSKTGCHSTSGQLLCVWLVPKGHQIIGAVAMEASLDSIRHAQSRLRLGLLIGVPFSILIALIGGWALASGALAPVEQLRRTAQSITATDLSRRIGLRRNDELGRLSATLDDMIDRLDGAFREQRQLTADVSHELRTPLSVIQGQASLALRRTRSPEEYAKVLRSIQEETERMSRIVSDLLLLARAESGQEILEHDPIRLDLIAKWAVEHLGSIAESKRITVSTNIHPVMIEGDADRIRQLTLNLLDNAFKYTDEGGAVSVGVGVVGGEARLRITDSGEGIPADVLPHIFQRFYRVDRSRSRGQGGSGLGLAIVHWIASAHGGSVDVVSRPGEGSTFTFRMPILAAHRGESLPRHKPRRRPRRVTAA